MDFEAEVMTKLGMSVDGDLASSCLVQNQMGRINMTATASHKGSRWRTARISWTV